MQAAFLPPESNSQLLFPFGLPLLWLLDISCWRSSEDIFSFGSFLVRLLDVSYDDVFERLFVFGERSIRSGIC